MPKTANLQNLIQNNGQCKLLKTFNSKYIVLWIINEHVWDLLQKSDIFYTTGKERILFLRKKEQQKFYSSFSSTNSLRFHEKCENHFYHHGHVASFLQFFLFKLSDLRIIPITFICCRNFSGIFLRFILTNAAK